MANQFLVKEKMAYIKAMSVNETTGLQGNDPTYAGVEPLGCYEKGNTSVPIIYYLTLIANDPGPDDKGSIVAVAVAEHLHHFVDNVTYHPAAFVLNSSRNAFGGWSFNGLTWLDILPTANVNTTGVLKQCSSSSDIALDPSSIYTQSEVQDILT